MRDVIGIDPAMNGAMCNLNTVELIMRQAIPLPKIGDDLDLVETAQILKDWTLGNNVEVNIEVPGIHPKSGKKGIKGMWGAYMGICGILATLGVRRHFIQPKEWQREMLMGTQRNKRNGKPDRKKPDSIIVARQLYPDIDFSPYNATQRADIADACLIATYGYRKALGALSKPLEGAALILNDRQVPIIEMD